MIKPADACNAVQSVPNEVAGARMLMNCLLMLKISVIIMTYTPAPFPILSLTPSWVKAVSGVLQRPWSWLYSHDLSFIFVDVQSYSCLCACLLLRLLVVAR